MEGTVMIQNSILQLTEYALNTRLIQPADKVYTINRLMELFGLDELEAQATLPEVTDDIDKAEKVK